jgi:cytochrome P450
VLDISLYWKALQDKQGSVWGWPTLNVGYGGTLVVLSLYLIPNTGEHHRRQRKLLNPAFSISHVRNMVPAFLEVTNCVSALLVWRWWRY